MKRLMVIAALAVAPLACVANQGDAPVRFIHARGLDAACEVVENSYVSAGSLDVSGGQNYRLTLAVETNNANQEISIGQELFSGGGLGDITLNELIYTYDSQPSISLPKEERVPIYAVYRPGTDPDESTFSVGGFGPGALKVLRKLNYEGKGTDCKGNPVGECTDDVCKVEEEVTVLSTIKGRGVMSGGQIVETNEITFPITVINSGYDPSNDDEPCPGDKDPAGPGFFVCIYGQDGIGRICPPLTCPP